MPVYEVPVSMLSLTIQLPVTSTASHCIIHPPFGISITSPGTKSSDDISSYSGIKKNYGECFIHVAVEFLLVHTPFVRKKTEEMIAKSKRFFDFK